MTYKSLLLLFLIGLSLRLSAQVPPTRAEIINEYIESYRDLAIAEMQRTGVPASIKLAQGILETEAGRSDLVRRSNNHFGIKCKSYWAGAKVYHDDDARGECFRAYPSAADSWKDHSDYLKATARYAALFQLRPDDYKGWANGLKAAGYATNPKYPQILIRYIEQYKLNDYSLIAMGKKAPLPEGEVSAIVSANPVAMATPGLSAQTLVAAASGGTVSAKKNYPDGVFTINETRVVYATAGASIKKIAEAQQIPVALLYEFNELRQDEDQLKADGLVYLQRKRTIGEKDIHLVDAEEDMYQISQRLGVRLESLLQYNQMTMNMKPALGEKIHLQKPRAGRPKLLNSK